MSMTPGFFQLEAAAYQLQNLEVSRVQMMELVGVLEAHQGAFNAVYPQSSVSSSDPAAALALAPNSRADELAGRMGDSMRRLGAVRNQASDKAEKAYQALERLPGFIRDEDLRGIRQTLDADDPTPAFGRLTSYLAPLYGALVRQRTQAEADLRTRLGDLQQIIAGGRPVAGLPAVRLASGPLLPPSVPDWARNFTVKIQKDEHHADEVAFQLDRSGSFYVGLPVASGILSFEESNLAHQHAEISFQHGGFWIRDVGEPSAGVMVNGRLLRPGLPEPISGEVRVQIGKDAGDDFIMVVPEPPILESLRLEIAQADSVQSLADRLHAQLDPQRHANEVQILAGLDRFLSGEGPLGDVPVEGGLRARLQEMILEERYGALRARYTPDAGEWTSQRRLSILTHDVGQADSPEALVQVLRSSLLPGISDLAEPLIRFFSSKGPKKFADLPETFGIRAKVESLMIAASMSPQEIAALEEISLEPTALIERPWAKFAPSPRLEEEFETIKGMADGKLNLERLAAVAKEWFDADPGYLPEAPETKPVDGRIGDWFYGGQLGGHAFNGRFALNVKPKYAAQVWKTLAGVEADLSNDGVVLQYRMPALESGFARPGSVVLFFHAKDQEAVVRGLQKVAQEHPLFFREGHPPFMLPIQDDEAEELPGIAFGEESESTVASFVEERMTAVNEAVDLAKILMARREPVTWQKLLQIVAYFLHRRDVSSEEPALEARGRERFAAILRYSSHRPSVPVSESEAAELAALGLNRKTAMDRRPWETADVTPALRDAFEMFLANRASGVQDRPDFAAVEGALDHWIAASGSYLRYVASGMSEAAVGDWLYAGDLNPRDPFDARIEMAMSRSYLPESWIFLKDVLRLMLAANGIGIQIRLPKEIEDFDRESVIYFRKSDFDKVSQLLTESVAAHPDYFGERSFRFGRDVADSQGRAVPCLSFGEEPAGSDETFVTLRAKAMKQGLRLAHLLQERGEPVDRETLYLLFAFFLNRAGVDPLRPALLRKERSSNG